MVIITRRKKLEGYDKFLEATTHGVGQSLTATDHDKASPQRIEETTHGIGKSLTATDHDKASPQQTNGESSKLKKTEIRIL
jgi:hypothetical protein